MTTQSKHPLLRHARAALVVALLLFAVPVLAVLEDYAWQWPLHTGGADGLLALSLQAPVYERISRADLRDLAAFNQAGEPIPFGPAAQPQQRARLLQAEPREVPMFAVGREASAGSDGDAVSLRIRRNADGTLTQLDAQVEPAAGTDAGRDLLLDLSRWKQPVTALLLQLDETHAAAQPLNARVAVHGSSDLGSWRLLADSLAVVSLQEGGFRLQRLRLELPATGLDYLRIRRLDADQALPVLRVRAVPAPVQAGLPLQPGEHRTLQGVAVAAAGPGVFEYHSGGPFPVDRIDVVLDERNAIANVVAMSRDAADQPWQQRGALTAFRLGGDVRNGELLLGGVRDRYWRIATTPPQPRAPQLRIGWTPDRFLLLTQGDGPYVLAAGSGRAQRDEYPLQVVLAQLQAEHGAGWQPPQAGLGEGGPAAGDAALAPAPTPLPVRQYLLWVVLLGGALILVAMVLRLLRQPAPGP